MNTDIRVLVTLPNSPKLKRLRRRFGSSFVDGLLMLWCHTGAMRPKGRLVGMTAEDIEAVVGWGSDIPGEPGAFVRALVEEEWLDESEATGDGMPLAVHDWEEHQPWACQAEHRSSMARRAANARWATERKQKRGRGTKGDASRGKGASPAEDMRGAHAPTPSHPIQPHPNAVPSEPRGDPPPGSNGDHLPACGTQSTAIVEAGVTPEFLLNEWNQLAKAKGLSLCRRVGNRRKFAKARLQDPEWDWRSALIRLHRVTPDLSEVEAKRAARHFLQGNNERKWKANFEWFCRQNTVDRILEGEYDRSGGGGRKRDNRDVAESVARRGWTWAEGEDEESLTDGE